MGGWLVEWIDVKSILGIASSNKKVVHGLTVKKIEGEGLPPKIRSCILLRLQLQTAWTIIQTFGAKT